MDTTLLRRLRRHPLTRELDTDERKYLVERDRVLGHLPGTYIFHESQPRRAFGVILRGRLELQTGQRGRPTVLASLGPGESYGEGSLLDDYPHSTSAFVREAMETWEISREALSVVALERPELYSRLVSGAVRIISERMASAGRVAGGEAAYRSGAVRREHDLLGERDVPDRNYYGLQTLRAVENFPITGIPISQYPQLINALAAVKAAAAEANRELGLLDEEIADAIIRASREIREGRLHGEFVVDVIQGGAGTSANMNANEVIANRALELLGRSRGDYEVVHPNNHVNLSQSTNDAYPTALKVAAIWSLRGLEQAVGGLRDAFLQKGDEFSDIVKMGRTQLQDAVPMTLGQEFKAFGITTGFSPRIP